MTRSLYASKELTRLTEERWGPKHRWSCVYCGRPASQVDHFWPLNTGGPDTAGNTVPSCQRCNRDKSDHAPFAWMVTVGVPESRMALIATSVTVPGWTSPAKDDRGRPAMPPIARVPLDYTRSTLLALPAPQPQAASLAGLAEVAARFDLDPTAFTSRPEILRVMGIHPEDRSAVQTLYAALRARNLTEQKRSGIWGFWGLAPKSTD